MKNFLALYTDHQGNTKRQFIVASQSLTSLDVAAHIRSGLFHPSKILVRPLFDVEKAVVGASRRCEAAALQVAMGEAYGATDLVALIDPEVTDEMLARLATKLWSI